MSQPLTLARWRHRRQVARGEVRQVLLTGAGVARREAYHARRAEARTEFEAADVDSTIWHVAQVMANTYM